MLGLAAASLVAGALTVLAPCVLPMLPVIVAGSLDARAADRSRPYVIAASLVVSLVAFTLLLKASTVALGIEPAVWTLLSGGVLVVLGLAMVAPGLWSRLAGLLHLDSGSHALLHRAGRQRNRTWSAVAIGASLGPVFSSCSPTYAWVIATVLPSDTATGLVYLTAYCVGLAGTLLAVALLGRQLIDRIGWAADPRGPFARTMGVVLIVVGVAVLTGADRQLQSMLVDALGSGSFGP